MSHSIRSLEKIMQVSPSIARRVTSNLVLESQLPSETEAAAEAFYSDSPAWIVTNTTTPDYSYVAEELYTQIAELKDDIAELKDFVSSLSTGFPTFISSLGIKGLSVIKPIPATIIQDEDAYIASFLDANISTGGDTPQEAIDNLQSLIADHFDDLENTPDDNLGPRMIKQKQVLLESICRK